jgi:hypothetical protein
MPTATSPRSRVPAISPQPGELPGPASVENRFRELRGAGQALGSRVAGRDGLSTLSRPDLKPSRGHWAGEARAMSVTIMVTLTEDEAIGLAQVVDMANAEEAVAHYVAMRETIVWPEKHAGVTNIAPPGQTRAYVRTPVFDKEAAAEAVRSAQAKVLEALEAAGVEISPADDDDT